MIFAFAVSAAPPVGSYDVSKAKLKSQVAIVFEKDVRFKQPKGKITGYLVLLNISTSAPEKTDIRKFKKLIVTYFMFHHHLTVEGKQQFIAIAQWIT